MDEIIFLVEVAEEGGYTARALGESIFTEGNDVDEVRHNVREAVHCHFDDELEDSHPSGLGYAILW